MAGIGSRQDDQKREFSGGRKGRFFLHFVMYPVQRAENGQKWGKRISIFSPI